MRTREKAVEAVAYASILSKNVKQMLSDTCSVRKRAALDALLQSLGYHKFLSRWFGVMEKENEERPHDVGVFRKKLLRMRCIGNATNIFWSEQSAKVSEISHIWEDGYITWGIIG